MAPAIKRFSIYCVPNNERNTFTFGDILKGVVVLEVSKETMIDKLYIKFKGDASVEWSEPNVKYIGLDKYFKIKQIFIHDGSQLDEDDGIILVSRNMYNNLVAPGFYLLPFIFPLPEMNLPPSFKGTHGHIKYMLEARLSRSWKLCCVEQKELTFVSKTQNEDIGKLMEPLAGAVEKKMCLFTSGSVSMHAVIDKMGYMPGEIIKVTANIENSSSRDLNLKYKLEQKQTYTVKSHTTYAMKVIFKLVEGPIPSRSQRTVTKELKIPKNLETTIVNCRLIKVEYTLKVYLDVPYAFDPEILLPLTILPAEQFSCSPQNQDNSSSSGNTSEQGLCSSLPSAQNVADFSSSGNSSEQGLCSSLPSPQNQEDLISSGNTSFVQGLCRSLPEPEPLDPSPLTAGAPGPDPNLYPNLYNIEPVSLDAGLPSFPLSFGGSHTSFLTNN